jgi:hypothetical protein
MGFCQFGKAQYTIRKKCRPEGEALKAAHTLWATQNYQPQMNATLALLARAGVNTDKKYINKVLSAFICIYLRLVI